MDAAKRKYLSKFLSLVLRHRPGTVGIELDEAGWVEIDRLLAATAAHGKPICRAELDEVVATNDKQRFAFSEDGARIRASQGHSVTVTLGYQPLAPPERLYHGTASRFVASIEAEGLRPGSRHHVHLSADPETATRVGARHGKPVVLTVLAGQMHQAGHAFFRSANGVWLTAHVAPAFLGAPDRDG